MNKLKPILAQKFWILFSLVLIMPLAGYFMTKGKLAADIEGGFKKLNDSFTSIPAGTGVPNDSWTTKLNDTVKQQELRNRRANQELWEKQKALMSWPKDIAANMAQAKYFKDLTEEQKGGQVVVKYPLGYPSQIRALLEIVDPLDDGVNLRDSDKRRKVAFAMADLHVSGKMTLENFRPTFDDIWGAQEDIWLQRELLQAIKRLNANSISQGDAFVKQLFKIQLFGGTKSTGDATQSAPGGGAPGMMGGGNEMMFGANAGGFGGGGSQGQTTALSADINLAEEFNAEMEISNNSGGAGAGGFGKEMGINPGSVGGGGATKTEIKRYLDYVEGTPYKRRGFSIKLVMDHRKVPDLIAELMNSPFPVEIVRVQQVWMSSDSSTGSGGGGGMGGIGAGGFAGFKPTTGADTGGNSNIGLADDGGAGGFGGNPMPTGGGTGRSGANSPGSAAAMADPNLATVAIVGVWTLYLPPLPAADAGQVPPPNSVTPPAGLAANPENAPATAETPAETVAADSKPATTDPTDGTGDDPKKSDDPDAPKADPAKPDKTESDSDKPATDKSVPKDDAADKSDSETK